LKAKASVATATDAIMKQQRQQQQQQQQQHVEDGPLCISSNPIPEDIVDQLLRDFADTTLVADHTLLPTTFDAEEEHLRSSLCVRGPTWGTRTTTIVYVDGTSRTCEYIERNHEIPSGGLKASYTKQTLRLDD
jgi:uncharacterized protein with NRDE domain